MSRSRDICIPRASNPSYIAHNKFIVLIERGIPIESMDWLHQCYRERSLCAI
mgnify:CR=1 FL=1